MSVLAPALRFVPRTSVSAVIAHKPAIAISAARRLGAAIGSTDFCKVVASDRCNAVVIATRHDSHAGYALGALAAGKHVFVEKPLGLTLAECEAAAAVAAKTGLVAMVDFNRRFSPHSIALKKDFVEHRSGAIVTYRVNAGP